MKKLKFFLILLFVVFQNLEIVAQFECDQNNNPNECLVTITCDDANSLCPQLSCENPVQVGHVFKPNNCRSAMEGILNRSARFAGLNELRIANDSLYCDQIQLAVDLNIGLIKNPATHWGTQSKEWWENMCYTVCDINQAYDCAGQRRPILEFMNLEVVDSGVCWYNVCDDVINAFEDEIEEKYGNADYPHTFFDIDSIQYEVDSLNEYEDDEDYDYGIPDITRLEAKMYMFYLAKRYMDCGYRGMNLADVGRYTKNDTDLSHLEGFIKKVKKYSKDSLGYKLTVCGGPEILKVGNNFLFDYVETSLRAIERTDFFPEGSACANDPFQAYISEDDDYCDLPDSDLTGISPDGCDGTMPILYKLDNHRGLVVEGGAPTSECTNTYGMDEGTWWKNLSEECQIEFFEYYYCNQNELDKKRYFEIPAMITPDSHLPEEQREKWILTEHESVRDAIAALTEPVLMEPSITQFCDLSPTAYCGIVKEWVTIDGEQCQVFKGKRKGKNKYRLSINNTDCSSTYGWSVQRPDGTWVGYHEDEEIVLTPNQTGTYTLFARQHNSAFENGSYVIEQELVMDELLCCDDDYTIIDTFCPCLKLQSNITSSMLSVDVVNVENSADNNFNVEILNNFGSIVKTVNNIPITTQNLQIVVSDLDNGVHYLRSNLCSEFNLEFVKF